MSNTRAWRRLHAAGFVEPLYADFNISCGDIQNGIGMRFGNSGGGVVSLEDLARLVADAFEARGDAQQAYELHERLLGLQAERVAELARKAGRG